MAFNTQDPRLLADFTLAPLESNPATGLKLLVWNPQTGSTEHVDWSQLPSLQAPDFGTGAITGIVDSVGDGIKTTWTLPVAAVSKNNISVSIDGLEDRSFIYTPSDPSVGFSNPLPSGVPIFIRIFGGQTSSSGVSSVAGRDGDVIIALNDIASGVPTGRLLGNTSGTGKPEPIIPSAGFTLAGGALGISLTSDQIADGTTRVQMTTAERTALAALGSGNSQQDPVISRVSSPPASVTGDRFIVLPTGTGLFAGHNNDIATSVSNGASFTFATPSPGWVTVVTSLNVEYVFGQSAWSARGGQVTSVFGRQGAVVAASGDYTAAQVSETSVAKIMTDVERTKLAGIATGANTAGTSGDAYAISHAAAAGAAHALATGSVAGFLSSSDFTKLGAATAAATVSTLALRDAAGRLAIATPSASGDAATKGYVDGLSFPSVGNGVLIPTVAGVVLTNSVTPTVLWQWTIPANYLSTDGDEARFSLTAQVLNNSGADKDFSVKVVLNGVTLCDDGAPTIATSTSRRLISWTLRVFRNNSTSARCDLDGEISPVSATTTGLGNLGSEGPGGGPLGTSQTAPTGIAWSSSQTLSITVTLSAADANYTIESYNMAPGFVPRQAGGIFALDSASVPAMSDNTTKNVSTTAHGFAPKAPNDALFKALSVQNGTVSWSEVSSSGGAPAGTTLEVYTDDPTIGVTDNVIEVYLGKRITLPAYDAGKQDRIAVTNPGLTASTVRANALSSVVRGFKVVDVSGSSATRFVSSVNAPGSIGNKLTASFWLREDSHTNNRGILHFGNGVEESTGSYFRISSNYASGAFLQVESRNAAATTLLRRFSITQGVTHHVLISIDLSIPALYVIVDGVVLLFDASLAGTTITTAQPIGGSSQPIRIATKITGVCEELAGSVGQFSVWLNAWPLQNTEQYIRKFYNDGPVVIPSTTTVNGTLPIIHINALPTGGPAAVANSGSLGGTFTDSFGSGVAALDVAGLDSPMLEQIDGFPDGYLLPSGNMATFIRRNSGGVWSIF